MFFLHEPSEGPFDRERVQNGSAQSRAADLADLNDILGRERKWCPFAYFVRKRGMDHSEEVRTERCPSPVGEVQDVSS